MATVLISGQLRSRAKCRARGGQNFKHSFCRDEARCASSSATTLRLPEASSSLQRPVAALLITNPDRLINPRQKNLAIAYLARSCSGNDRLHRLLDHVIGQ